jgi:hypothetical protein
VAEEEDLILVVLVPLEDVEAAAAAPAQRVVEELETQDMRAEVLQLLIAVAVEVAVWAE